MKTTAIIAEFNPFHNGHRYLIKEARKRTGADYCIIVMSGDFVQRGAPAMTDKYIRTRMALLGGADLVIELPVYYATASAEFFARGAVTLLDKLGVADTLVFGSECGKILPLMQTARMLSQEDPFFQEKLRGSLKKGMSYPAARLAALELLTNRKSKSLSAELPATPNNILAIEYCKALLQRHSTITPITLSRRGSAYHDIGLSSKQFSSASAIRNCLERSGQPESISASLPPEIFALLDYLSPDRLPICEEDFSLMLHYKLLMEESVGYTRYLDVSEDLSDKIRKHLYSFDGYRNFIRTIKSKEVTYARISRCMTHILLDIEDADMQIFQSQDWIFYARILGLRRSAGTLLHSLKKNTDIPLLSKLAKAPALLGDAGQKMLQKDVYASHLYHAVYAAKYDIPPVHEYTRSVICME